jgi:hypothetical protein
MRMATISVVPLATIPTALTSTSGASARLVPYTSQIAWPAR